jgi:hypothetical protein
LTICADPLPGYWLTAKAVGKGIGYPLETFARTVAPIKKKEEPKTKTKIKIQEAADSSKI